MNPTQASWRKLKLLEMLNFKTRSGQGSGIFSQEIMRTSGTGSSLCPGFSHRRESPSGSHSSHGGTERLFVTDGGPRNCQRWERSASSTTCLHKPWHPFFLSQIAKGFSENYRYPSVDCFPMHLSVWIWTATGAPLLYRPLSLSHTYTYKRKCTQSLHGGPLIPKINTLMSLNYL